MSVTRRGFSLGLPALASALAPSESGFYADLVRSNDGAAAAALKDSGAASSMRLNVRRVGSLIETLAAAYCCPESTYYRSAKLLAPMETAAGMLVSVQHADGTIDSGNLSSPPDTAFVVETVATALAVLRKAADPRLDGIEEKLGGFLQPAGAALVTGGVHTPNHRWVISAALARLNSLFPAAKYVERIDDWLGEGIYIDADGQFPERSTGIYSRVEDAAFVTMARLLQRPGLLEPVRRNLEMTLYYAHPDGEMETVGSRRQDHNMITFLAGYYLEYRYLAVVDRNPLFAAVAQMLEAKHGERLQQANLLINFLEEPLLNRALPQASALPTSYAKVFGNTNLARIRRNDVSATVYGGSDWPLGVASGLASNAAFFRFRKGKAILESVRMGGVFFSEGAFRSNGLTADGNRYTLHQRLEVPYHQPLAKADRNARGDYRLTPVADARFWSKLDFPRRRVSNVQTLDQKVTVVENDGAFELQFDISGHDRVPYIVELTFRPGGKLDGPLTERTQDRAYLLREGTARYTVGGDTIEFGPGAAEHDYTDLSGSSYRAHEAVSRTNGLAVYITGFTPFRRTLKIRAV